MIAFPQYVPLDTIQRIQPVLEATRRQGQYMPPDANERLGLLDASLPIAAPVVAVIDGIETRSTIEYRSLGCVMNHPSQANQGVDISIAALLRQ